MKRPVAPLFAALSLITMGAVACSEPRSFFAWPAALDVGFFIAIDGSTVSSIDGPIFDGSDSIALPTTGEEDLVALGWTIEDLQDRFSGFDSSRVDEIVLSSDVEECAREGRLLQDRLHTRWPTPDVTRVFDLDREAGDFEERPAGAVDFESWSVALPTGGPPCGVSPDARLRPFGDGPRVLGPSDLVGGISVAEHLAGNASLFNFEGVERLDEDRVLVASRSGLFLFDRTRSWTDSPSERVFFPEEGVPLADSSRRSRFGILAVPNTDRFRVVTFAGGGPGADAGPGRVLEVELTAAGFGARQVSPELGGAMHSVAIDGQGRIVAAGGSTVYVGPSVDALESHDAPTAVRGLERDPEGNIWMVGLQAYVGQMNLDDRPPSYDDISLRDEAGAPLIGARVSKLWFDDRGPERTIWASTKLFGRWAHRLSEGWRKAPAYSQPWPASNQQCELSELVCGRTEVADDIGITLTDPMIVVDDACPHVLVEYEVGCTAAVDNGFTLTDELSDHLTDLDDGAGWVTVVGSGALLLEMKL